MSLTAPLLTYLSSTDLILNAVAQAIKKGANDVEIIISYQYSGLIIILLIALSLGLGTMGLGTMGFNPTNYQA